MYTLAITKVPMPIPGAEESWQGASIPAGAPVIYYPGRATFDPLWCCTHGKGPLLVLCGLQIDMLEMGVHLEGYARWDGKTPLDFGEAFGYFRPLLTARDPWPQGTA